MKHSDFIVYVDESGDHSLTAIDPSYPLFVLALCVLRKTTYNEQVAPALRQLKFNTFGHDMVVLHERDIRKRIGAFSAMGQSERLAFIEALNDLIARADFQVIAALIDKRCTPADGQAPGHAYHLALKEGLRTLHQLLREATADSQRVHIVCEARGAREDAELILAFHQICEEADYARSGIRFEIVIAHKHANSEGLQLADLVARPLGLSVLRPSQANRAADILAAKLVRGSAHPAPEY